MPERTIWIAAALLGLVVAVALAVLTSYVARPPAGLTSQPVSAGRQLAPARDASTGPRGLGRTRTGERRRTPLPAAPAATETPDAGDDAVSAEPEADSGSDSGSDSDADSGSGSGSDDDSGRSRGRGRGRGGDD